MAALPVLPLLLGHDEHVDDCGPLYEPARQGLQVVPNGLYEPAEHAVQARLTPEPETWKPGEHVQVVDPAALVLPVGQAVQLVAPTKAAYVLAGQMPHTSEPPVPEPA